ncbi:hypothetical protein ACFFGH_10630 [Lysobacter korlensis]|uniref:Uncharacterized protein n=1 Tax=Lysobacter korlensis TaxID=553636 RepID=A0ABV6RMT7_9GAMM
MASKRNKSTKKNGTRKATTHARRSPIGARRHHPVKDAPITVLAAHIRELWVIHGFTKPVFDFDPVPLDSEKVLGRRPSEAEYSAAVALLLMTEYGHDCALQDVVQNRPNVAWSLHRGIEPELLAAWVDVQHRTIPTADPAKKGHLLVWRYAEWNSEDEWASGADFHTAMYSTEKDDITAIGGFGGHVMYEEVEVPIGSWENTSAQINAGMSRRS